jgi:hypothetical protein
VRLLRAGTERGLASRALEAVGLEDALKGLGGRAAATGAATAGRHGGGNRVSGGGSLRHFVLRLRETFRLNATSKKWSPLES